MAKGKEGERMAEGGLAGRENIPKEKTERRHSVSGIQAFRGA